MLTKCFTWMSISIQTPGRGHQRQKWWRAIRDCSGWPKPLGPSGSEMVWSDAALRALSLIAGVMSHLWPGRDKYLKLWGAQSLVRGTPVVWLTDPETSE